MANPNRAWFHQASGWWKTEIRGKQVRLAFGRDADAEARATARLAELLEEAESTLSTVHQACESYLDGALAALAPRTAYETRRHVVDFQAALGARRLASLKRGDLKAWLDAHSTWGLTARANAAKHIKRVMSWCVELDLLGPNAHSPFANMRVEAGPRRRPMSEEEFVLLWQAANLRLRQILTFMAATGCRPAELRNLLWQEVDFPSGFLKVRVHKTSRKTGKLRLVALTRPAQEVLVEILLSSPSSGPASCKQTHHVFLTPEHQPYHRNSMAQCLKRLRRKLGIAEDAKLYGIRHSYGTRAIKSGVDLKTVSELMGHATTRMTEHYLHLAGDYQHLKDAADKVH